jgi:hypothetical protein
VVTVFNKLVVTALKYTPVVFAHHLPVKELPSGKLYVAVLLSRISAEPQGAAKSRLRPNNMALSNDS